MSPSVMSMDIEHFNRRIVEVQEKLFDAELMITGMAIDLLNACGGNINVSIEVPFYSRACGCRMFMADKLFFDEDRGAIGLADVDGNTALWDEIDIQSKELIVNEVLMKVTSDQYCHELSAKEDIH